MPTFDYTGLGGYYDHLSIIAHNIEPSYSADVLAINGHVQIHPQIEEEPAKRQKDWQVQAAGPCRDVEDPQIHPHI